MANSAINNAIKHDCNIDDKVCQQARMSRDPRFDGQFFTGVLSTGIYCRSICPAPAPLEKNVRYFDSAIKAANHGLRPCLRCRPDSAPHSHAWIGNQLILKQAVLLIEQGYLQQEDASITQLADELGISTRYLSKLFNTQLGTTPKRFAIYQQVMFAKQLLHQTHLSITEIGLAAGFNSIRRFNEVFKSELLMTPTDLRKNQQKLAINTLPQQSVTLTLSYRPPLNWSKMLTFYQFRQVTGMEVIDETTNSYSRSFDFNGVKGAFVVSPHVSKVNKPLLNVAIEFVNNHDIKHLHSVVLKLRKMLDLDADMQVIDAALAPVTLLGATLDAGQRIPATASVFEAACRAVLGQQVSVVQATKLLNTFVLSYGETLQLNQREWILFPSPQAIASASLDELKMPGARKLALNALAEYIVQNPDSQPDDWLSVKGIGPWTVAYAKMRGQSDPNVFLSTDLVIKNRLYALYNHVGLPIESVKQYLGLADEIGEQVSPWGSYLTFRLWEDESLMS